MDKAGKIFSLILTLALFTASIVCSIISASGASGTGGSIFFLCMTVFFAGATGICVIVFYLGGFSEKFAFGLIFPRKFLKRPPIELSPAAALAASGNIAEAKEQLKIIIAENPDCAEAVEMFVFLPLQSGFDTDEALAYAETYLKRDDKEKTESNAKILFRTADILRQKDEKPRIRAILEKAASEECYSNYEKQLIGQRLSMLK